MYIQWHKSWWYGAICKLIARWPAIFFSTKTVLAFLYFLSGWQQTQDVLDSHPWSWCQWSARKKQIIINMSIKSSIDSHWFQLFPQSSQNTENAMNVNRFKSFGLDGAFFKIFFCIFSFASQLTSYNIETLCIDEKLTASTSIWKKLKKKHVLIVEKCVNMYVKRTVFTVLLMVFRQWMILLILKLNYCMLLKVYPV